MIEVKDLSFSYGQKKILDQVSFQLDSGEFMAVLGVNGVGKSTLSTCMNRIHKPQNGVVLMNGQNVLSLSNHEAAKRMAYVSQFSEISRLTVFDTVLLGRKPYMKWSVSADDMELCNQILERLEIGDWKLRYMDELSGGEKQKVMLARAMAQEPELLLLDEPTSCLDPKNRHDVLELVKAYIDEKRVSGLMVIHDVNLALRYCNRFLFMKHGGVLGCGGPEIVTSKMIQQVYEMPASVEMIKERKIVMFG